MVVKLLKLPLKFFALAAALCLFLIHATCGILLGLSSIVTRLLASVFLLGAAVERIAGAPDVMAYQCLGIGIVLLIGPTVCAWAIGKVVDLLYAVLDFISR